MQVEDTLANEIGSIMLDSNSFANLNAGRWEAKQDAFVSHMVNRFGREYPHDVIRRVAEVVFETGLEIIKLRNSLYQQIKPKRPITYFQRRVSDSNAER
jgi:hypothetical protein